MLLNDRIKCFETLGKKLKILSPDTLEELLVAARNENAWFTAESVLLALEGIGHYLDKTDLNQWLEKYDVSQVTPKNIGVVAAGNIPLVGFHDILCVLLSGHHLMIKLSSKDQVLLRFVLDRLIDIEPAYEDQISFVDRLNDADAFIATGSDNSARYFEYYFKNKPSIIRKNRTSVVVLTGKESDQDFENLGKDIFQYFGLGCRNVSKAWVPANYDFTPLLDHLKGFETVADHHKYRNNYDYNKSIYLVNGEKHLDTGFLLIRESDELVSPISVLYYETYRDETDLQNKLASQAEKIQCVIGSSEGQIPFGQAQQPRLWDYADGVDTMKFLCEI